MEEKFIKLFKLAAKQSRYWDPKVFYIETLEMRVRDLENRVGVLEKNKEIDGFDFTQLPK